ncbi:uncharacterized protein VP01_1818g4 [Puccinia sorghi]|uniref:Uncharacterized protein n=1 Tax=Puccinia sorghi TaxID=27349 RepID=A0A0L6VFY2_9BASI|nr:uncharacterized protein VP01_1818g4 [Puccinia sorghi]
MWKEISTGLSLIGKLFLIWDHKIPRIPAFKSAVIKTIHSTDTKELGAHAQEQDELGQITCNAVIHHGGRFSVNQKAAFENSEFFKEFLTKWGGSSETHKLIVTLVKKDPAAAWFGNFHLEHS